MEEEILAVIRQRASLYSCVQAQAAYAKERNEWWNVFTLFTALHRSDRQPDDSQLDYGNLLIATESLTFDEFRTMMRALVTAKKLCIPQLPEIRIEGSFEQRQGEEKYISSHSFGLDFPWPSNFYLFRPSQGWANAPSGTLFSKGLPLFPDANAAIESLFRVPLRDRVWQKGGIVFLLPNYKAKLLPLKIGKEQITTEILAQDIDPKEVQGKIYIETESGKVTRDFVFTDCKAVVPIPSKPLWVLLYIFSAEGEILDYRRLFLTWPGKEIAAYAEFTPEDMRQTILQGESETVEFKLEVKGGINSGDEFVESVAAFANSNGGTVFIGVDNSGNIKGVDNADRMQQAIQNMVRAECEPIIRLSTTVVRIDDADIVLVEVPKGEDKPYFVREKGFYTRAGASDRIMTRYEVEEIYAAKQSPRPRF